MEFWELAPSPNSVKVRLALRFKGIEFEAIPVDPGNRKPVIEVSGQELTPVIRDQGVVLNDSEAILQFLDANYRGTPRIFPSHRDGRRECDEWKRLVDDRVARAWSPIFFHAIGRADAPGKAEHEAFREGLQWLETELGDRDSFRGPDMPVCDLRVAEWAVYALPGEGLCKRAPFFAMVRDAYAVQDGEFPVLRRFLEPWNARLA